MTKLTIEEEGKSTVYEIFDDEVLVGRGSANQIQLRRESLMRFSPLIRGSFLSPYARRTINVG